MGWSGFFRGVSAVIVAIALLVGGSFALFQFVVAQFTAPPPRPSFANDTPSPTAKPAIATKPTPAATPVAATPKPSPSSSPTPPPQLKRARITLSEGLNVRQSPSANAERVDGVDYSDEVTILQESPDKEWLKVRVESSGVEGWIKSGYAEPIPSNSAR